MNENYIKIKRQLSQTVLKQFKNLKYVQNLRDGIEFYDSDLVEDFFDSIRFFILLKDTDMRIKKFIVFWIDFFIQNYGDKISKSLRNKIDDIIITLDIYPLLYDENYIEDKKIYFNVLDEIRMKIREKNGKLLNNTQYFVRNKILEKKNIVFSAPTSFGKSSIVIDSINQLIEEKNARKILFILPTKALINEYRRKIKKVINDIIIIENPHVNDDLDNVIYLFTPERFLVFYENNKNLSLDYVINDEAQTLININKKKCSERTILLAKVLSIISNRNVPMIFLMPYISQPFKSFISQYIDIKEDDVIQVSEDILPFVSNNYYILDVDSEGDLFRYDFSKDAGITNVNKKYIGKSKEKFDKNSLECWGNVVVDNLKEIINVEKKFIIFCTNKNEIKLIANRLIINETCKNDKKSLRMQALINYIEKNLGPEFEYINFLKNGIAVHFSEIDSYIRRQVEIIFNEEEDIKGMICTSTLLQGVNLNAQNLIMIYGNKFSTVGNVDIDYRNLIGRSARLGINIQGNIYNITCCKNIEKEGSKLYKSSEPVKINFDKVVNDLKKERDEVIETYACDIEVKTKLKNELNTGKNFSINNLDYFIGYNKAIEVENKINLDNVEYYGNLLKNIGNYEKTLELIKGLADIYQWEKSKDFNVSQRMKNYEYIAFLAVDVFNGENVRKIIEKNISYVKKNKEYKLVVCKNIYGGEYVTMIKKGNSDKNISRDFIKEIDINTYIYTILYDIQHIIEFELKKYIQDLYYRVKKINNNQIIEVEEILDYSTIDKKKIALNNIGIVDNFAINMLVKSEFSNFFTEDGKAKIKELRKYANELLEDDPMKYAILDVL